MRTMHVFLLLALGGAVAGAQAPDRAGAGRRGGAAQAARGPQRDVRREIERMVRTQVQPTEAQLNQIRALDRRLEPQRLTLNREEQATRLELRRLMQDSANVDQNRISEVLDRLLKFPRRRAELMETEQRELTSILTPLQRAKYLAIQEQLRRMIERGRGGPPGVPRDTSGNLPHH